MIVSPSAAPHRPTTSSCHPNCHGQLSTERTNGAASTAPARTACGDASQGGGFHLLSRVLNERVAAWPSHVIRQVRTQAPPVRTGRFLCAFYARDGHAGRTSTRR